MAMDDAFSCLPGNQNCQLEFTLHTLQACFANDDTVVFSVDHSFTMVNAFQQQHCTNSAGLGSCVSAPGTMLYDCASKLTVKGECDNTSVRWILQKAVQHSAMVGYHTAQCRYRGRQPVSSSEAWPVVDAGQVAV